MLERISSAGLGPKLVAVNALVAILVAAVLTTSATSRLDDTFQKGFTSKAEAIAVSLASATEQSVGANASTIQASIDSNKVIDGVAYIYVQDLDGSILVHTFSPSFPAGLEKTNPVEMGELSSKQRVKIAPRIEFRSGDKTLRALDVAAPVSGGALGVVHVGMDRDVIDARVHELRTEMLLRAFGVGLLGVLAALALIAWMVVRPIRALTRVTADIVEKGDLTQKIEVVSNDEIGQLARTFTRMVERLKEIPTHLDVSAQLLTQAVSNLGESTREQSEMVTKQAAALQETQVTAQEIQQTSLAAAQRADAVLVIAKRAGEVSRAGETAIAQTLNGLAELRGQVEEIAQRIRALNEQTRRIDGITATVKDLADQSKILALNAAIEAVKSGEQGKGFAVVAREIRSLAEQSLQATKDVKGVLNDITGAIQNAVEMTETGAEKMQTGLKEVRASGESLKELSAIVQDNSAAVQQIAQAVSQQNAGIAQIFGAVTELSQMMKTTVERIGSTHEAATVVKGVSEKVAEVVRSYKV